MNINMNTLGCEDMFDSNDGRTLAEAVREHHEILGRSGRWTLTGEVALVSDPDPELASAGSMQVWSKTAEGMWLHITPDGVAVESVSALVI